MNIPIIIHEKSNLGNIIILVLFKLILNVLITLPPIQYYSFQIQQERIQKNDDELSKKNHFFQDCARATRVRVYI